MWCMTRAGAAHIQLDDVRALIRSGLADPQEESDLQAEQYELAVRASIALARVFAQEGYDVVIDDALEPGPFDDLWRGGLADLDYRVVILLPSLDETLRRSEARDKRVQERHTLGQHASLLAWEPGVRVDSTDLTPAQTLDAVIELAQMP
jgi:hypothetical protein